MRIRETVYLVRRGHEYLVALGGPSGETETDRMQRYFSIYRYDAAQIPRAQIARQIIQALRRDGDAAWSIERYNKLSLSRRVIWTEGQPETEERMCGV
jgi:hypothetical protein